MADTVSTYIMEPPDEGYILVRIDRQTLKDGRACNTMITPDGEILGSWWDGGPQKQRRGSRSRYCFGQCWDDLTKNQRDALSSIRTLVMNDGKIKSRKRTQAARHSELVAAVGSDWLLRELLKAGAIYEKGGWFYVDRRFLFRG